MLADFCLSMLLGVILDRILGDPTWIRHPVCLIGSTISKLENFFRSHSRNLRMSAVFLTLIIVIGTGIITISILAFCAMFGHNFFIFIMAILDWFGLAEKSLKDAALDVEKALKVSLEAGRERVSRIVGRDTWNLNSTEVICATVETIAENTTDAVISPMIWGLFLGPVGLWMFKATSTLDSMVGYMDKKYRDIGWSSAKLDDILNFIPARVTGFLLCLSAGICRFDMSEAFRIMIRDHSCHASPNCAWSEAPVAGALRIRLGGTHLYFGKPMEKPTIGDDCRHPEITDIIKAIKMMSVTQDLFVALILTVWIIRILFF